MMTCLARVAEAAEMGEALAKVRMLVLSQPLVECRMNEHGGCAMNE